jgi:hypothetical protein
MDAYEVHAHKVYVRVVHAHEVHAREVHPDTPEFQCGIQWWLNRSNASLRSKY